MTREINDADSRARMKFRLVFLVLLFSASISSEDWENGMVVF